MRVGREGGQLGCVTASTLGPAYTTPAYHTMSGHRRLTCALHCSMHLHSHSQDRGCTLQHLHHLHTEQAGSCTSPSSKCFKFNTKCREGGGEEKKLGTYYLYQFLNLFCYVFCCCFLIPTFTSRRAPKFHCVPLNLCGRQ